VDARRAGRRRRVLAPDSYGAGKSPDWPSDRAIRLLDEVALIEPVLARAGSPLAPVGHSYGAAVALIAALADPRRVRAMVLYEPVLFGLLDAETPPPNEADGIRDAVADAGLALEAGNLDAAAERFIDYWMGRGAWKRTPEARKPSIAASVVNVRRWGHALFTEPTPLEAFRSHRSDPHLRPRRRRIRRRARSRRAWQRTGSRRVGACRSVLAVSDVGRRASSKSRSEPCRGGDKTTC